MRKRSPIWGAFRKVALTASLLLVLLCAIGWWRSWRWSESLSLWTNAPTREEWDRVAALDAAEPLDEENFDPRSVVIETGPLFSLMHDQGIVSFHSGDTALSPREDDPVSNGLHWAAPAEFYARSQSYYWTLRTQNWKRWRWGGWAFLMEPGHWSPRATVHVNMPYWFLMLVCAAPWMLEGIAVGRRKRLRRKGLCIWCKYDRRGIPIGSPCPECGKS